MRGQLGIRGGWRVNGWTQGWRQGEQPVSRDTRDEIIKVSGDGRDGPGTLPHACVGNGEHVKEAEKD